MTSNQRVFGIKPSNVLVSRPKPVELPAFQNTSAQEFLYSLPKWYRQMHPDGNCIFRAFAISYLSQLKPTSTEQAFPEYTSLNLCVSTEDIIPLQMRPYYILSKLRSLMQQAWTQYLPTYIAKNTDYESALCEMLNSHVIVNLVIILYLRAQCLKTFDAMEEEIALLLPASEKNVIRQYGKEPQAGILYLLGQALKVGIKVRGFDKMTKYQEEFPYPDGKKFTVTLFYRSGHYQIFTDRKEEPRKQSIKEKIAQKVGQINKQEKEEKKQNTKRSQKIEKVQKDEKRPEKNIMKQDHKQPSKIISKQPQHNMMVQILTPQMCEICVQMKTRKCFRCRMKQINCPIFSKVINGKINDQPKQKLRSIEVSLKPQITKQIRKNDAVQILPPKIPQPALKIVENYSPKRFKDSKDYQPPELLILPEKNDTSSKQCIQCNSILVLETQLQTLICRKCLKNVQIEERLHEYRSKTAEKVKFKEAPKKRAIFPDDYQYNQPLVSRYANIKKRY